MSQLARAGGLRPHQIGMWEAGTNMPSPRSIRALGEAFGIDPLMMLDDVDPRRPSLYHLRVRAGLGRADVARRLAVSRATIHRLERGDPVRMRPAMLDRLAATLDCAVEEVSAAIDRTRGDV